MMQYTVQKGDTIAKVTGLLNTDWKTLRSRNPGSVGRLNANGNWFLREGATVSVGNGSFAAALDQATAAATTPQGSGAPDIPRKQGAPDFRTYTVRPGDTLWALAVQKFHVNLDDLVRDNAIADPDMLQVGQQLRIRRTAPQEPREVVASWYGTAFHGKPMANGDTYDMYANTIAHKELPLGTRVELTNPLTGQRSRAVVTDRGPYIQGREVDLSYGLARKLSMVDAGVGTIVMKVL